MMRMVGWSWKRGIMMMTMSSGEGRKVCRLLCVSAVEKLGQGFRGLEGVTIARESSLLRLF